MINGPEKVQGGYKPETSEHGDPPTGGSAVRPTGWRTERLGFFERRVPVYDEPAPEPPAPQKRDVLTWLIAALLWGGAIFAMARAAGLPVWNSGWAIDAVDLGLLPFGLWNVWFWLGRTKRNRR